jgi:hypothetical protein
VQFAVEFLDQQGKVIQTVSHQAPTVEDAIKTAPNAVASFSGGSSPGFRLRNVAGDIVYTWHNEAPK